MDNPRFVDNEDIPFIDDEDYDNDYAQFDTPDTSTMEETSFTRDTKPKQPDDRLSRMLLHDHIVELYRYLDVDPGNVDLVNTDLFKAEKSKNRVVGIYYFDDNDKTLFRLTNERTGKFLAKSTLQKIFGGVDKMKRILVTKGDRSFTASKNCKNNYQLTWIWKKYHSKILTNKCML